MYHRRTSLNRTTTNNSSTPPRTNTPLTARRTLPPPSSRFFSQQQKQQQHHTQNNHDAVQPYSSEGDFFPQNSYRRNASSRMTTCDDDHIPSSSPSIKRKHAESSLALGYQMDDITNCLKTVLKQQEIIVDGLQILRKSHEKLQKTTNSLLYAKTCDQISADKPVQLPVYVSD